MEPLRSCRAATSGTTSASRSLKNAHTARWDLDDAVLMLDNCYHGAGANTTPDKFRGVIVSLFCKGVYRAEEN